MEIQKSSDGYEYYIDKNEDIYMTAQQLKIILGYSKSKAISNIVLRNKGILEQFRKKEELQTNAGKRDTFVYDKNGIIEICKLSGTNIEKQILLLKILNIPENEILLIINRNNSLYKQTELEDILHNSLENICIIHKQVKCGNYRIDFVLNDNIAIECNENNHIGLDIIYEANRKKYLTECGYRILEYNPDGDNIFKFINQILLVFRKEQRKRLAETSQLRDIYLNSCK